MRYAVLYVEIISECSDNEVRSALSTTLSGAALKTRDGTTIGQIVHAQVTEGPSPTRQGTPEEGR